MTAPDEAAVPQLPVPREALFTVPAVYATWREQGPVRKVCVRDGRTAWAITRQQAIREALSDPGTSADRLDPRFPNLRAGVVTLTPGTNLLHMDEPEHGLYRRMLIPEFTGKRIAALRPAIQNYAHRAVDDLLQSDQPADFWPVVGLPIPSQVICALLGIDYDHHELFQRLTTKLLDMTTSAEDFRTALEEVQRFMREEVQKQCASPGDGVIGRMVVDRVRAGELDEEHLVGFAMLLLIGGYETTAKMITLGMLSFLADPGAAELVRRNPDLMPGAVEDILRLHSITDLTAPKLAASDVVVQGCRIPAGDGIMPLIGAANHDPELFPDPERFDPTRDSRGHLTFGAGVHGCLGQNLARAEMEIVLSTVLRRVPTLRLAVPVERVEVDREAVVWGVKSLPVLW